MSKTVLRIVFAATLLFSLADQIPLRNTRWVEDEGWYGDAGKTFLEEGRLRLASFPPRDTFNHADTRPPAMSWALALSFKLFGVGLWQARLPSYLARTGAILLIFLLGVRYAGLLAGVLAAALLLSDNYLFVASRTVRPEALVTCLFVLTLWLYHQARERKSLLYTFLASLAATAAMAFHVIGFGAVLALGVLLLIELRFSVWKSARAWCYALTVLAAIGAFALWIHSDQDHIAAYRALYVERGTAPLSEKLQGEVSRYMDFVGFSNQRTPLPVNIPLRGHIALAIAAAFLILWRFDRTATIDLAVSVLVTLLWLTFQINKTARYLSLCTPMFALVIALAAVALMHKTKWKRAAGWAVAIVLVSQLAGNALLLYSFRNADYRTVSEQLRAAIPPGKSAYGLTTFWLALHDRRYFAYDRAPFDYALPALQPDYLILNDRVMMHGSGRGIDDFQELREQANAFASLHATLVATIPSPFYGTLAVYHVCYNGGAVRDCAATP